VSVRLKWFGPGEPISYPNYKITSTASGTTGSGTVTANNGFKGASGSPSANASSYVLMQPGKTKESIVTLSLSSETTVGGYASAGVSVLASIDGRVAKVKASAIPDEYYVKGNDLTQTSTLNDALWDKTIVRSQNYNVSEVLAQNPVLIVGATCYEIRLVGLPEGYISGGTVYNSRVLSSTFTGLATTNMISGEHYTFTESLNGTSVSETLPSFAGGWDIQPLGAFSYFGGYSVHGDGTLTKYPRETSSDIGSLKYSWTDGLEANSEMQLLFRDKFSNERLVHMETIHDGVQKVFVFPGPGSVSTVEWQPWEGAAARRVRWTEDQIAYKAVSSAVNLAAGVAAVCQPEAAAVLALLGVGLSIGSPSEGEGDLTPAPPFEADTDLLKHERSFSSSIEALLAGKTDEEKLRILSPFLTWKALYISEKGVKVFVRDHYNTSGYAGPAKYSQDTLVNTPIASQAKKFIYKAE
jgi:hypothetical protein